MTSAIRIPPRDRDAVLQALRAGVVPRRGLQYIQVGRAREVEALIKDIDRINAAGSAIRFVIGDFGAGKTFFLSLVRAVALEKGLVTMTADLNPDRRLYGSGGQARSLYSELTRNIATRTKPEGGAMASVVERFITTALQQAKGTGEAVESIIQQRLQSLTELVGGYDFAQVIECYWRGHDQGNEQLKADAVRWLRGEFTTKTDARQALGVRTIIEDDQVYDGIKLLARFIRLAGYGGLLVCLDELVNLYKLPHATARNTNYEQILRILNDTLQGSSEGVGFVFGGTPETLMDARRGLYSYQALQSRLSENAFAAQQGLQDFGGPVIRLANLTPEDLYVLLTKLRHLHASGDAAQYALPDEALPAFLSHCNQRIGAAYFQTPRNTVRAFLDLLSVLEQHAELDWNQLIEELDVSPELNTDRESDEDGVASSPAQTGSTDPDDELASFRL